MDEHRERRRAFMLKHKGAYEALAQGTPGGCGCQYRHLCSYHEGVEDERDRCIALFREWFEGNLNTSIYDDFIDKIKGEE